LIILGAGGVFCWKKLRSIGRGAQRLRKYSKNSSVMFLIIYDGLKKYSCVM
jgi:hypothetical protein